MSKAFDELMHGLEEVRDFLEGQQTGFRVHVPHAVDVKQIRSQLQMTQAKFSEAFGFSLDAIKHWEGGRRNPEVSARAYLTVIAKNPAAVMSALSAEAPMARRVRSTTKVQGRLKSMSNQAGKAPGSRKKALAA